MTAHPEFEAIAEFIFAKKIDTDYFRKAAQMNAHFCACPECKKIYEVMLTAKDRAEALARCVSQEEPRQEAIARGVAQEEVRQEAAKGEVQAVLSNLNTERETIRNGRKTALQDMIRSGQSFLLKVRSLREIVAEELTMYHPMRLSTVKSTGDYRLQRELQSILVDEGGNRIRIDEDGSLSLYFDRGVMPAGQMVALIPVDQEQQEMVGIVEEYDRTTTRVCFEGILPGEFRVMVG